MQVSRVDKTAALLKMPQNKIRLILGGYHWSNMEEQVMVAKKAGYGVMYKNGGDISVQF
jgi:hypothetical protein